LKNVFGAAFAAAAALCGLEAAAADEATYTSLSFLGAPVPAGAGSSLFTSFENHPGAGFISWLTCGSTPTSSGCYGSGQLGGFGNACAMLSGTGGALYVMDRQGLDAKGNPTGATALLVYKQKIDETPDGVVSASIVLAGKFPLPVKGGARVKCFMAANAKDVVLGTDKDSRLVFFDKKTRDIRSEGGEGAYPVQSITANEAGYVLVNLGDGFAVYGRDSVLQVSGGAVGQPLFPNKSNGVSLAP
jgi:hypothetical protein